MSSDDTPAQRLNAALAAHQAGRFPEAEAAYQDLLSENPLDHDALQLLGLIRQQQRDHAAAIDLMQRSLALRPSASVWVNLAMAHREAGDMPAAISALEKAVALDPENVAATLQLGALQKAAGRHGEAVLTLERARALRPADPVILLQLANAWHLHGDCERAVALYREVLPHTPHDAGLLGNLGMALQQAGRFEESAECFRQALSHSPRAANLHSNLLLTVAMDDAVAPAEYLAEARRFAALARAGAQPFTHWTDERGAVLDGPLRIGLVSGDLRNHPVGFFLESVIANVDPGCIAFHAFPTREYDDPLAQRLHSRCVSWQPLAGLDDAAAAARIHAAGIHILIHLAGHTALNRLPVFAWRPAPVQVSWLGYFASTGLSEIDWLIVDPVSAPANEETKFVERLWRLPHTRLCFSPPREPAAVIAETDLPALSKGHLCFGSFQALHKLDDRALALWARVLAAVPGSRLRIQNKALVNREAGLRLLPRLARAGIDPSRVTLCGPSSRARYLAAHAEVDVLLDTFPFPGGTTTCEALWMGVPTLTLTGHTLLSRQGASLLTAAGLPDWVARDEDEFVALAVRNAGDLPALAALRARLRSQVEASPLMDAGGFAAVFVAAMQAMWQLGCNPPE